MISNIQKTNIELIQWLSALNDEKIIKKIVDLRKNENVDWWKTISDSEKLSIEKGISDADSGKLISHRKVRKLFEKWL
jgi:hypothetical protein